MDSSAGGLMDTSLLGGAGIFFFSGGGGLALNFITISFSSFCSDSVGCLPLLYRSPRSFWSSSVYLLDWFFAS